MDSRHQQQRRFERVSIPRGGGLIVTTPTGDWLGAVRSLGGGGLLLQGPQSFLQGQHYRLRLIDEVMNTRVDVDAVALYSVSAGIGFQFAGLEPVAAGNIANLIAKHRERWGGSGGKEA